MAMRQIVCFGEALIDFLAEAPARRGEPIRYVQHAGGAPANVAVAVARLGGRAAFVGMLGADPFGDFLHAHLRDAGVDVTGVVRTAAANTALAFVTLDRHGERSFSFYRPPAADLLFRTDHFRDASFAELAALHACSNSLTEAAIAASTLHAMHRAAASGALVSFDVNLRPALWAHDENPRPRIWSALHEADLVKVSAEELAFLGGPLGGEAAFARELWQGRARLLIVTDGAAPIRYRTRSREGRVATLAVDAVDTTAAGDAFVGGLLHGLAEQALDPATLPALLGDTPRLEAALRFAAACGALAVTRPGAFAALPRLGEVRALLGTQAPAP
jgi:fructokinase